VDINIAPLVDNPQRRSKSAIKYLEAAAVGVPTVAARLEPYCDTITEGVTVFWQRHPMSG
jgi:rhamnosyltransferase